MKLLADVGNTRAKWAWHDDPGLHEPGSFVHRDADCTGSSFEEHLAHHWGAFPRPEKLLCCCVAGSGHREALRTWVAQTWSCPVEFVVSVAEGHGVKNAYTQPHTLGADRWVALLAARQLYSGAVCIVDCGTAVTVDVLGADGAHRGGLILPGLELMRQSLRAGTGEIRLPTEDAHTGLLASSTTGAVVSGTLHGVAGAVDRVHAQCVEDFGEVLCVLTGGDAQAVMQALRVPTVWEPHLVVRGLSVLAGDST